MDDVDLTLGEEVPDPPRRRNRGQFRKGTSGNPAGRPKGAKGLRTIIQDAARRKVPINLGGKRRNVAALEALITITLSAALKGDRHAREQFLRYCERYASDELEQITKETLTEGEQALLASILGGGHPSEGGGHGE